MTNYGVIYNPQDVLGKSLDEIFSRTVAAVPDKVAIIDKDKKCTYNELNKNANIIASGLASLGIKKGDRVAILAPNSIETIATFLAVAKLGAITVGLNWRYRETEIRFMLENSGTCAVVAINKSDDYDFISLLKDLRMDLPQLKHIISFEPTEDAQSDVILWSELYEAHRDKGYQAVEIDAYEDFLTLLYTSGTTGLPKGAKITHFQATKNATFGMSVLDVTADDVIVNQLPWYHAFSFIFCINLCFITGATMVIQDPYNPVLTLKAIEENKVTIHHGTPPMFIMEMNHKDFKNYDVTSLRSGITGSSLCSAALMTRIKEELHLEVASFYGMTETCGVLTCCLPSDPYEIKSTSVGIPIEGCEVKLCDFNGQEIPKGEVGEIWCRGWNVIKGYWDNEEETKKQITADGWMKTGDLARYMENNYLELIGRQKELINKGGYKVYPMEVEDIILRHPKVVEVAVVGTPNETLGELVCACILLKDENNPLSIEELREFCKEFIADYKVPDELCILPDFTRTSSGKVRKFGDGGIRERAIADTNRQNYRQKK